MILNVIILMTLRSLCSTTLIGLAVPALSPGAITVTWTDLGGQFQAVVAGSFSSEELSFSNSSSTLSLTTSITRYDTTPSFFAVASNDNYTIHFFGSSVYAAIPSFSTSNNYTGTASGDTFAFAISGNQLRIYLPITYEFGQSISSSVLFSYSGMTLSESFKFGNVVTLDGNPLITYIDASAIPEPSTYGLILGGLVLTGAAIRRRRAKK